MCREAHRPAFVSSAWGATDDRSSHLRLAECALGQRGKAVRTVETDSWAANNGRNAGMLLWDWRQPTQASSNRPFQTKPVLPRNAPEQSRIVRIGRRGRYGITVPVSTNDVVLPTLEPYKRG